VFLNNAAELGDLLHLDAASTAVLDQCIIDRSGGQKNYFAQGILVPETQKPVKEFLDWNLKRLTWIPQVYTLLPVPASVLPSPPKLWTGSV
jgi:hypothetical protein